MQPMQIRNLARANADLGHIDVDKETMIEKREISEDLVEIRNIMEVDWQAKKEGIKEEWTQVIQN